MQVHTILIANAIFHVPYY